MPLQTPKKRVLFMRSLWPLLLVLFGVFSLALVNFRATPVANAAASTTVNFQARLQTGTGALVPDGYYDVEFKLYDASSGGTNLWTEDYTYNSGAGSSDARVKVVNGYLSANLGSITAFPGTINWDQQLYLTMNIGGTTASGPITWDGEMTPRLPLTAVPYAFQAKSAQQIQTSQSSFTGTLGFDTLSASQNILLPNASGTVCLTTGNCVGSAGGAIGGGGTLGTLAMFTPDGYNIGNSILTQSSGTITVGGNLVATGSIQSSTFDAASTTTLNIGTTNATTINLGRSSQNTAIGGLLSLQGTNTGSFAYQVRFAGTLNSSFTGSQYGFDNETSFNPTGASVSGIYGMINIPTLSGSSLAVNNFFGQSTGIVTTSGYTGQITNGNGLNVNAPVIGGSQLITTYTGINVSANSTNGGNTSGTINNRQIRINGVTAGAGAGGTVNNYGISLTQPSGSGGTTNNYGLYILGNGDGTTGVNYSIYNGSTALSYFTGAINSNGGYHYNGTDGASVSCSGGQFLQNQVVQGGITTGGTCASAATGLSGSGTDGTVAMFSGSGTNLGNSILTQSSGTITVGGNLAVTGTITSSSTVQGTQLISTIATGTAPLTVTSTTKVANLNADLLDGLDSTAFQTAGSYAPATGSANYIQNQIASPQSAGFNISGAATANGGFFFQQGWGQFAVQNGSRIQLGSTGNTWAGMDFIVRNDNPVTVETNSFSYKFAGNLNLGGNVTSQRDFLVGAHNYSGAYTIQNAATFAVSGAPGVLNGASIVNAYSIWSQGGTVRVDTGGISNVGLQIAGKTGQTADLLQLKDGSNNAMVVFDASGDVGIGTASPAYKLDIQGGAGIVGQFSGRVIGANAVNTNEFVTLGQANGNYIQNTTSPQTADFNITGSGTVGGNFTNNGAALFKNSADSTTAFQIQNASSTSILIADTTNGRIGIGTATPQATLDVAGSTHLKGGVATVGYTYTTSQPSYGLTAFSGTSLSLGDDDMSSVITLPFSFNFYDQSYSDVYVCANGYIVFLPGQDCAWTPTAIPDGTNPNAAIYGVWRDLNPGGGGTITYGTVGTAPNQTFIVYFNNVAVYDGTPVTFQIQLNQADNSVVIQTATSGNYTSTQGLEDAAGANASYLAGRNDATLNLTNDAVKFSLNIPLPILQVQNNSGSNLLNITNDSVLVQGTANGASTFGVQNASGVSLLNVDTSSGRITAGTGTVSSTAISLEAATFAAKVDYVTGSGPQSVTTADMNGDGKLDIVVANYTANTVSVLMNNGTGTFATKVDYATGSGPISVTAADLNGDGRPDIVVANRAVSTVSVFMNNGNGTFAAKVDYATGSGPQSVTTADMNGDGKLDIVVANYTANTVSVLMNNGTGTFATKVDYATGSGPISVTAADLNGDGRPDIVVANNLASTVSVLMNNGNGTFASKVDYATGTNPFFVTTADLNGDGKPDIVVANINSSTVSVLMNNGNGTFAAKVDYATGTNPRSVTATDLNGDGKPDVVVANNVDSTVSVLINNGNGTFAAKVDYATGSGPWSVTAADLNGDGRPDIVVANNSSNTVSVFMNTSNGSLTASSNTINSRLQIFANGASGGVLVQGSGDLLQAQDNAGSTLLNVNAANQRVTIGSGVLANTIYLAAPNIVSTFAAKVDYATGTSPAATTADLNGDGKADIVTANYSSNTVSVFMNNGDGTFAAKVDYTTGTGPNFVTTADFNNDGKPDLAVPNYGSNTVSVFMNNGDGTFAAKVDYTTGTGPASVATADFNGDNHPDIVVSNNGASTVSVLMNTGTGTFAAKVDYITGTNPASVTAADLNGDGKADLAVANASSDTVSVFMNTGTGTFAAKVDYITAASPQSVTTADFNGDGKADLAIANYNSNTASVFMNMGDGTFNSSARVDYTAGTNPYSVAAADFNGDGEPDLAVANDSSNTVSVLINNLIWNFSEASATAAMPAKLQVIADANQGGVLIQGAVGQTGNLFQAQSSTGAMLMSLSANGNLSVGSGIAYTKIDNSTIPLSFAAKVDYATDFSPQSVATADLNGDGKPDIVAADTGGNTVSVFMNNGNGTFAAKVDYATGASPQSVATADLNGDGKPDIVAANVNSNTVSVLMNNGDGTFASKVDYTTGTNPFSVATADLNGDGKADIVTANYGSNTVSVLMNTGTGTFAAKVDYTTGAYPQSVATADLNGDGKADLVVANSGSNTVSVLMNTGTGTFAAKVDYATGTSPISVATADLNGDGKADLAVLDSGSNTVSVLMNTGTGTFASKIDYPAGSGAQSIATADFNGDSKADIVTANYNNSTVSVLMNTGTGTFASKIDYPAGANPWAIAAADFNGDSKADIVTANYGSSTISVLINNTFTQAPQAPQLSVVNSNYKSSAFVIQGAVGQTASMFVVQDASANPLFAIGADGSGNFTGTVSGAGATANNQFITLGQANTNYIQNTTTPQTADFNVTGSGTVGGNFTNNGAALFKNSADSTTAFQIQNAGSTSLLTADSTNQRITIGSGAPVNAVTIAPPQISVGFATQVTYTTGTGPISTATADLNGDGKADIVAANYNSNTVSVFMNTGTGTFAAKVDYATGTSPRSVATADLNGDGKPDIVIANYNSSTVSVFMNNGDGTFAAKVDYATGAFPRSVTIADLNGDGKADIVAANYNDSTVSVLMNTGTGTFAAKVDYTTGSGPRSVTTADLNGDGKADIVAANVNSNTVSVLMNTGTGTFAAKVDYATGSGPISVATADLNGDGKADIVAANANSSTVSVLMNTGTGTFAAKVDYTTGSGPISVATADLNGDNEPDIVATNVNDNTISVLMNTGTGTFSAKVDYATGFSPYSVATADLNGDGKADIVVANYDSNTVSVLMNDGLAWQNSGAVSSASAPAKLQVMADAGSGGLLVQGAAGQTGNLLQAQDGSGNLLMSLSAAGSLSVGKSTAYIVNYAVPPSFAAKVDYATGTWPWSTTTADLNGDGKADLVVVNYNSGTVSVLMNNGDGTFAAKVDYTTGTSPTSVATADFNGDGKPDIVTANNNSSGTVSVLMNTGTGTFAAKVDYATGAYPDSVATADFNGDGKPDIVTANNNSSGTVSVLMNTGTGTFAAKVDYATGSGPISVATADLNGDGKADIIAANANDNTVSVLMNTGTGTFAAKVDYATGTNPNSVTAADLNGDGKADIIATNANDNTVSVLMNTGTGTFAAKVDYATGTAPISVTAADLNGDGKPDIIATNANDNTVSVLMNTGTGTFASKVDYATGTSPNSVTAADLNGDGKPDIVVANSGANTISVLMNTVLTQAPKAPQFSVVTSDSTIPGIVIQGSTGQTADLLHIQDSTGNPLFVVSNVGNLTVAGSGNFTGTVSGADATASNQFITLGQANANYAPISSASPTLQDVYNNSSNPATIVLTSTNHGLAIQDASSTVGGNLFAIQSNGGATSYLAVTTSGASVAGTLAVSTGVQTPSVDNPSSTLTLGASATSIVFGSSGNTITFTSGGGLVAAGSARHTKKILLAPEFAGAVLDAQNDASCTGANNGTMTSSYDSTGRMNFYNWMSSSASAQCYDVVVQVAIPSDFDGWSGSPSIQMKKDSTGTGAYALQIIPSSGTDANYSSYVSPGTLSTSWSNMATSSLSGTYTAGDYMTVKVRMTSTSGANVGLGNITLTYYSKY